MRTHDAEALGLRFAIAAGEASGDTLGAGLIEAINRRVSNTEFFGVAGPRMRAAGCAAWHETEELSVMGLAEVLRHLPRLIKLRGGLVERLKASPPDVFVGIDSPDFNLPVAKALKSAGTKTIQYVSPQVWAWRQSRVHGIREAVDLVLCVLPFETDFYARHGVPAIFVGHPLAEEIPLAVDRDRARGSLGLDVSHPVVALLPGSRRAEVGRLSRPFAETAAWLRARAPDLQVVVALADEALAPEYHRLTEAVRLDPPAHVVTGRARDVIAAADAVLTASGTASLETMLLKRPMVVAYRMTSISYWIYRRMGIAKLPHFSLPNLLAGRKLVDEFVQNQVRPDKLGPAVMRCLDGDALDPNWLEMFDSTHRHLRQGGSDKAAEAVLQLIDVKRKRR